jgi:hypothetical protein
VSLDTGFLSAKGRYAFTKKKRDTASQSAVIA